MSDCRCCADSTGYYFISVITCIYYYLLRCCYSAIALVFDFICYTIVVNKNENKTAKTFQAVLLACCG